MKDKKKSVFANMHAHVIKKQKSITGSNIKYATVFFKEVNTVCTACNH